MIEISFNGTDARLVKQLEENQERLRANVQETMTKLMLELQRRIQAKLSGEVLVPRSSNLLNSVRRLPTVVQGTRILGRVTAGAGLTGPYAAVQEYGGKTVYDIFPGSVTGKSEKKALAFFPAGSAGAGPQRLEGRRLRFKQGTRRGSLKPSKIGEFHGLGGIVVKHVEHPPLRSRSFMRSSQAEMRDRIIAELRAATFRSFA
jgi:hypothetical protein